MSRVIDYKIIRINGHYALYLNGLFYGSYDSMQELIKDVESEICLEVVYGA